MDAAKRELVRASLIEARYDLDTARLSGLPDGRLDAAIYHCQQASENALNGFLAYSPARSTARTEVGGI